MTHALVDYPTAGIYDESIQSNGQPRKASEQLYHYMNNLEEKDFKELQKNANATIAQFGISFTVYSDKGNIDRLWPFDVFPRAIDVTEWSQISKGLMQRLKALNHFIEDVYNEQRIFKDGIVPLDVILSSKDYRPECKGMKLKHGSWACICGTDLVRGADGTMYVLEDNLRVPSGVSYMLENRAVLLSMLRSISTNDVKIPEVVVLTPGVFNSAYYEHAYLAHEMGAELVEGTDLEVLEDDCVYMRNIDGLKKVDVIYDA